MNKKINDTQAERYHSPGWPHVCPWEAIYSMVAHLLRRYDDFLEMIFWEGWRTVQLIDAVNSHVDWRIQQPDGPSGFARMVLVQVTQGVSAVVMTMFIAVVMIMFIDMFSGVAGDSSHVRPVRRLRRPVHYAYYAYR